MATASSGGRLSRLVFLVIVIVVSVVLILPALLSQYMGDDYFFTGAAIPVDTPFGYYNFTQKNIETEIQPWWTSHDFKVHFFRPLSSLTLHLDYSLWPSLPLLSHLHSVIWFVLLLVGVYRIFTAYLAPKVSKWAFVLFSLSVIHSWCVGWIASRHAVMGGAIVVWAATAYLRYRREGNKKHATVSTVLFVLGLLTSEVCLSLFGFVLSYETLLSKQPLSKRIRAALPVLLITVIYLVFYKIMGFGTNGSDWYNDPFSQPLLFLLLLTPKALSLIGANLFGVPASMRMIPGMEMASLGAGITGLFFLGFGLVLCWSKFDDAQKKTVEWLLLTAALTLLPAIAGLSQGREFMLSSAAMMGVIALILTTLFSFEKPWKKRLIPFAVAGVLFFGTLVLSPLSRMGMAYLIHTHSKISQVIGTSNTGCEKNSNVLVLTGDFDIPIIYAPQLVAYYQNRFFSSWHQVTITSDPVTITRPNTDRLELSSKGAIVDTLLLREKENPLKVGDVIERKNMRYTILEATDEGPTKIALEFKSKAYQSTVCALTTEEAVLKPVQLPKVGESVTVAYKPYI